MKTLLLLTFYLLPILCLPACRPGRSVATVPLVTQTVIKERLVEVQTPADSAWLTAYLECDSNYNVLIHTLSEKATPGMQTDFNQSKIDNQKSKIEYKVIRIPEKVYLPARDSIIRQDVPVYVDVPFEVNRLKSWQHVLIWLGAIFSILLVALIGWLIIKLRKKFFTLRSSLFI